MEKALIQLGKEVESLEQSNADIRRVIDLCYTGLYPSDRADVFARSIMISYPDNKDNHLLATAPRRTAGGLAIQDTFAVVYNVKGKTELVTNPNGEKYFVNCRPKGILSTGCSHHNLPSQDVFSFDYKSIVDTNGNVLFPDGLRSLGNSVADEISFSNGIAMKNIDVIDLGTIADKAVLLDGSYFYIPCNFIYVYDTVPMLLTDGIYQGSSSRVDDLTVSFDKREMRLYFVNSSVSGDLEAFKRTLNGVNLMYHTSQSKTVKFPYPKLYYRVSGNGTEQIIADELTTEAEFNIGYREALSASEALSLIAQSSIH